MLDTEMISCRAAFTANWAAMRLKILDHKLLACKWTHSETAHLFFKWNHSRSYSDFEFILFNSSAQRDLNLCRHTNSEFTCSLSSMWLRSRPLAWAIRFPATRFPTITEAGPTSATNTHTHTQYLRNLYNKHMMLYNTHKDLWTWLLLSGFGQVGDAGVRTHEDAAGV